MDANLHVSGNVGNEVEFWEATRDKGAWATFRLGHTPRYKRGDDWVDQPTNWFAVHCRRALAENVYASLRVGDRVVVSGRMRTQTWTDQKTGELRERQVLEADAVGHDLRFGTSNWRRAVRRRDGAQHLTEVAGRGGDDPWATGGEKLTEPAEPAAAEVHPFPADEQEPVADPEMEPVS